MKTKGFCDLHIDANEIVKPTEILNQIKEMGYRTVAFVKTIDTIAQETSKKKKKGEKKEDIVPPPATIPIDPNFGVEVLQRLNVHISEPGQLHKVMSSPNFKKYDLFSVAPESQVVLQHIVSSFSVDIISFNPINKLPFKINRKTYNMAVSKNMFFEIQYSPVVMDATCRKNTIFVGHYYQEVGKLKNIIISSGGNRAFNFRAPHDVINLSYIFGFDKCTAKNALTENCRLLINRAILRIRKAPFEFNSIHARNSDEEPMVKKIKLADNAEQMET